MIAQKLQKDIDRSKVSYIIGEGDKSKIYLFAVALVGQ